MTTSEVSTAWGTRLERTSALGRDVLAYTPRPTGLLDVLDESRRWDERIYLTDDERSLSYAAFRAAVDRVADRLAAEGIAEGDRVMLLAGNSIEWVVAFWALVRLGAIAVLGNAWWTAPEVAHAVALVRPRLTIADARRRERLAPAAATLALESLQSVVDGGAAGAPPLPTVDEDDVAVLLFTSGTTGPPKAAQLTHRGVIANQHAFLARTGRLPSQLTGDHAVVTSLLSTPLFHTGGIQSFITALLTGGRLVFLMARFTPEAVIDLIERERVTVWAGVPTMVQRVVQDPRARTGDLSSVRAIGFGGAPLAPALVDATAAVFPNARRGVSTNYGSTEAGGIVTTGAGADVLSRPGTSGRPLPAVEVAIQRADAEGRGEILVRSAAVFAGYWEDDEVVIDKDGWLHTGDIGRLDGDGFLYVVDRLKDIIIRGGENIACPHVEGALLEHPAVLAVAAFGLPHADLGEEVAAAVVAREPVTTDELRAFAAARLAHFQVPARWWIRDEPLPENASGKVDKRMLRESWPA